jgi:two-component system, NtrC family, response regulator AtoC
VRELQNIIERIVVLKRKGLIDIEDLPEKFWNVKGETFEVDIQKGYDTLVSEFEKTIISKALQETSGVKSKAAQMLNMNRTTLIEKMKRLRME